MFLASYDYGIRNGVFRPTGVIVYVCRLKGEYREVNSDVFDSECLQHYFEVKETIDDIAKRLQVYDHDFWTRHKLAIVPREKPSFWCLIWNYFRRFFKWCGVFIRLLCI